jgi:hypothetical protein
MTSDFDPYHRWLGIPPEEQPPDYYRLLGISRFEQDREVISNASDQRMAHLRSFASGQRSVESQRLLNEVAAATHCLLDPAKKLPYDNQLRAAITAKRPQPVRQLPVATAIASQESMTRQPLPSQARPLQASTYQQSAPAANIAIPVVAENYVPQVAARRPLRRGKKRGLTPIIVGLVLFGLIGAGGIYAYRASQNVAETPSKSPKEKPTRPAPVVPVTPVQPEESSSADSKELKSAAGKDRQAWFYTSSPEGARGLVYHDMGNRWVEKTSDGRSNKFVEREVTDDAVSLVDVSRKLTIWLRADRMTFSRNGSKEALCMKGEWVPSSDVSALLASLSRPSLPEPRTTSAKPIAVYRFDGESLARFKTPRGMFDTTKPFTVEFWYRRKDELKGSAGLLRLGGLNLVIKRQANDAPERHFCHLFSSTSGTAWNANSELLVDQEWRHVAVTSDGKKIDVHHDGKPMSGASLTDLGVDSLEPITFGSAQSSEGPESFQGEIKSVRVSNKAKYRAGQAFMPPAAEPDQLPLGTSLALTKIKEATPESMRRTPLLSDLLAQNGESLPKVDRVPAPEGDSLKDAQTAVANVYGERAKAAQKREDKQKLAAELLKTATTDKDAARSYALLLEGRRLAVASMDVALGIEIINEMDRRFKVERVVLLEKLLAELDKRSLAPQQREVLVDEALAGAQSAMKLGQAIEADSLSVLATRGKGKDPEKRKFAQALRERASAMKSAFEAMQAGLEKLKDSPDDPEAHLAVGRYLAFIRGDFAEGCKHLIKGSDATIAAAAQKQLSAQSDDDRLAALEGWNALLASLKSPAEKLQLQRYILDVCEELRPRLTGLALAQAEKHISEVRPAIAEADKYTVGLAASRPVPGLIVRIIAGTAKMRFATPFVATAKNNQDLAALNAVELLRPYRDRGQLGYLLAGVVVVENDMMEVLPRFENCNVLLNGRPFISQRITLKKGVYRIAIESTRPGFAFDVNSADSGQSLLFHHPSDLERELAQPGIDLTGTRVESQLVN